MDELEFRKLRARSIHNRGSLCDSDLCGCYFCLKIFKPDEISKWTDGDDTAVCPYCDSESVIAQDGI